MAGSPGLFGDITSLLQRDRNVNNDRGDGKMVPKNTLVEALLFLVAIGILVFALYNVGRVPVSVALAAQGGGFSMMLIAVITSLMNKPKFESVRVFLQISRLVFAVPSVSMWLVKVLFYFMLDITLPTRLNLSEYEFASFMVAGLLTLSSATYAESKHRRVGGIGVRD